MSASEYVVAADRWSLARGSTFRLRRDRILPGPLKSLPRRSRRPVWLASLGIPAVSVAAAFAIAQPIRTAVTPPAAETVSAARVAVPAPAESVRVIASVAAETPSADPGPTATRIETPAPTDLPNLRTSSEPASSPPVRPVASATAPTSPHPLDLGQLPVLDLDAATFAAPTETSNAAKPPARTAARRPSTQP